MSNRIEAVLFDFDGVLAPTPAQNFVCWRKALTPFGVTIEEREYYLLEGGGPRTIASDFISRYQLNLDASDLAHAKDLIMRDLAFPGVYPQIPGILSALKDCGVRLAVVTGSSRQRLERSVPVGILKYFEVAITSDEVTRTKPDPEPYLLALEKLKVPAFQALVIENAPLGILSAKAAGIECLAISTTLEAKSLLEAKHVVANHDELREHLLASVFLACS